MAAYYAVFGGEYTLLELVRIRGERADLEARLVEGREELARLRARADSLENDDRTLERLARERFGLIRDGEVLYRFAEGDRTGDSLARDGTFAPSARWVDTLSPRR